MENRKNVGDMIIWYEDRKFPQVILYY